MPNTGDVRQDRLPTWERGAANLRFAKKELAARLPGYAWNEMSLVGHSTGGDIASLLATQSPNFARALITLDHRRVPLPRTATLRVLSIRGSDFQADAGVLPSRQEQTALGYCIVHLPDAHHDDMNDGGPAGLKSRVVSVVLDFLVRHQCDGASAETPSTPIPRDQ